MFSVLLKLSLTVFILHSIQLQLLNDSKFKCNYSNTIYFPSRHFLFLCIPIIGPSGRSLVEIQQMSGAIIQISKKGIFSPGTRNRIVTISGPPNTITLAHYLIEQKINEEESKRARQNAMTGIMQ